MPRYDKEYHIRDSVAARYIEQNGNKIYQNYTLKHLKNALNFTKGCAGSEAKARVKCIENELKKRNES